MLPEANIFTPFGSVVAFQGDTALVSAFPTRFNGGFVYLFKRSAGAWTRIGTLNSTQQQLNMDFIKLEDDLLPVFYKTEGWQKLTLKDTVNFLVESKLSY